MKLIFVGNLEAGFSLTHVASDAVAEELVIKHMASGKLADSIELYAPEDCAPDLIAPDVVPGVEIVLLGDAIDGIAAVGPFVDGEAAFNFAERVTRHEGNDWHTLCVTAEMLPTIIGQEVA